MLNDTVLMNSYKEEVDSPYTDSLTGLFNHGFFIHSLAREIEKSMRYNVPVTLALIDIDSFARYNKRHNPFKGDRALKEIADIVRNNIRKVDLAARFSGDVFAVIYTKSDNALAAGSVERIRQEVEKRFGGEPTVSVGLACHPADAKTEEELLSRAEEALLHAKMKGTNSIYYFREETPPQSDSRPKILVVDDDPRNVRLMEALLVSSGYEVLKAFNGEEALSIVTEVNVDLILLDIMMPGMNGYEVCRRLKESEKTRMIPVLVVTALSDTEAKTEALEAGADDFITKFPNKVEFRARVKSLLRIKSLSDSLSTIEKALMSLANAIERKDEHTQGHVQRVASMAVALGQKMGLSEKEIGALRLGSILHDIGNIEVSSDILRKPSSLSDKEWKVIKAHPDAGYRMCLPLARNLGLALQIIRHHHERPDGSGYPNGLSAQEISVPCQIMTVVDIYDALTNDRPFRKAMGKQEAIEILRQEVKEGKLDKEIVQQLVDVVGEGRADGK